MTIEDLARAVTGAVNRFRRGGSGTVALLVAAALVLALAVYGGTRLVEGGGGTPRNAGHRVAVLEDPQTVRAVLPDLRSVPSGWSYSDSGPQVSPFTDSCIPPHEGCVAPLADGQVRFWSNPQQKVSFEVLTFSSAADARQMFGALPGPSDGTPLTMPAIGDQSTAVLVSDSVATARVRVGTTLMTTTIDNTPFIIRTADTDALAPLARMFADRSQEAQSGRPPTARAQPAG
ncbi:hypothetical protein [Kitasatospora viridis]|uniref:PknH-like protein n=1 Tax=Kitasatospora viridis TaxID=281105 RepID=A0A561TVQ5_9ACTN|nr:hypothetical protein [Kitasatospora viridis]TWF91193.1 hypothetical protein FHX73_12305 [Kitasatospora viridis]